MCADGQTRVLAYEFLNVCGIEYSLVVAWVIDPVCGIPKGNALLSLSQVMTLLPFSTQRIGAEWVRSTVVPELSLRVGS